MAIMSLQLCGFAFSNYYNKVKLQLLEKRVDFEEKLVWTGKSDPGMLVHSPMGKVPFLLTEQGAICESSACCEYIESVYPQQPLLPADPFAAAKVRELLLFLELHLELPARELYAEAFFGGKVADSVKDKVRKLIVKGAKGLGQLAKFSPYIAGAELTLADCAATAHLPAVAGTCKAIYGEDLLAPLPWRDYLQHMNARPTVQKLNADRKANTEVFMAKLSGKA